MDLTMEKAQGKVHQNPEHSLLASLSNPQVTLLSVQKRCTFRRSPGLGSLARSESSEEKCPPKPEEELSPGVLARTLERRSQVSAVEHGLGALGTELEVAPALLGGEGWRREIAKVEDPLYFGIDYRNSFI